jgi:hypothetical protein
MNRALLMAGFCLLAACGSAPPQTSRQASSDPPEAHHMLAQPNGWRAVLIAGDDSEPAFGNAVDAMAGRLTELGVQRGAITVLKAGGRGDGAATAANIVDAFRHLSPGPGGGCFVFITSHGSAGRGLVIRSEHAYLSPANLDRLLSQPCRALPTVVIASGCFSGSFAEGAMPEPNRLVLTAARDDRPSFGCRAGRDLTVFDQCILENLRAGAAWRQVMDGTRACVAATEQTLGSELPSEPQMWVGAEVAALHVS